MRTSLIIVALLIPLSAGAQQTKSARAVLNDIRAADTPMERADAYAAAKSVLQQAHGMVPKVVVDSVADGLTSMVIATPRNSSNASLLITDAVTALAMAGAASSRIPYSGAFTRLRQIFLESPEFGTKSAAVTAMGLLSDRPRAIGFLMQVAERPNLDAYLAVKALANRFGGEGITAIRTLDSRRLVKNDEALRIISEALKEK